MHLADWPVTQSVCAPTSVHSSVFRGSFRGACQVAAVVPHRSHRLIPSIPALRSRLTFPGQQRILGAGRGNVWGNDLRALSALQRQRTTHPAYAGLFVCSDGSRDVDPWMGGGS
jgi:hypothetical protein